MTSSLHYVSAIRPFTWSVVVITPVLNFALHYNDVIMTPMVSQITSLTIVYSSVYSDADQRKHQSSAPLAFVRGIHRSPVNSPHKRPVTRKMLPFGWRHHGSPSLHVLTIRILDIGVIVVLFQLQYNHTHTFCRCIAGKLAQFNSVDPTGRLLLEHDGTKGHFNMNFKWEQKMDGDSMEIPDRFRDEDRQAMLVCSSTGGLGKSGNPIRPPCEKYNAKVNIFHVNIRR